MKKNCAISENIMKILWPGISFFHLFFLTLQVQTRLLIMKLFNADTIKKIDQYTCEEQNLTSVELMERAADSVTYEVMSRFTAQKRIVIVAGPGNNGGDALAVARMLIEQGYKKVEVFLFNVIGKLSADCDVQRKKLLMIDDADFTEVKREFTPPYLDENDVVIDGLFGTGLKEPLQGGFKSLAECINSSNAFVVSIDTPSGLACDWNGDSNRRFMFHANLTLSFQFPRISFFFEENHEVVGQWKILNIELSEDAIRRAEAQFYMVEEKNIHNILKPRRPFTHKRDYGSVLLFAGSMGMMGAAVLAARAALRAGAGLVTVHSAKSGMSVLQTAVPEAMFEPDRAEKNIVNMNVHHSHQAIAVGPGIGTYDDTVNALEGLLKNTKQPMVLDADALNCMAKRPSMLTLLTGMSIITPHAGEFDRLFGEHRSGEERLRKAIEVARQYNIIVVLKGHHTAVVRPDGKVYFNSTGNAGMATAGAGDVLTGLVAGLLAQGYKPELAAIAGVYIHGMAGDLAARKVGQYSMTSSDIISYVGAAIMHIINNTSNSAVIRPLSV